MQEEILQANPESRIRLLSVNGVGFESGNVFAISGRDIPLLQDVRAVDAWGRWDPVYRDVVVVGPDGRRLAAYNLTEHDIGSDPELVPAAGENYAELLQMLRAFAGE